MYQIVQDIYLTVGEIEQLIGSVSKRRKNLCYSITTSFGNKVPKGEMGDLQCTNFGVRRRDSLICLMIK